MKAGLFPGQGLDAKVVHAAIATDHPRVERATQLLGFDFVRRVEQVARRARGVLPTALAQPAIFVAGVVSHERALESGESFGAYAGHSLGEYTALVAARSIPFDHGLRLVAARGAAMQAVARTESGGMAAVLGLEIGVVEQVATTHGLTLANDNAPSKTVLSGQTDALARAAEEVRQAGGRCVLLPLEGAFHSRAMEPAAEALAQALMKTEIRTPSVPVISNVTARPYRAPGEIRKLLLTQLTGRVRFRESLQLLSRSGVTDFVDLGPGDVVARLAHSVSTHTKEEVVA